MNLKQVLCPHTAWEADTYVGEDGSFQDIDSWDWRCKRCGKHLGLSEDDARNAWSLKVALLWIIILVVVFTLAFALTGCGEVSSNNEDYQKCLDAGGSYEEKSGSSFECNVPPPTATVTVTEGEY